MAIDPPRSVVLNYSEHTQQLIAHAVDAAKLAPVVAGELDIPILLEEHDFNLDDEFARRIGAAMLTLIALGQPDIKQYMNLTKNPVGGPSGGGAR